MDAKINRLVDVTKGNGYMSVVIGRFIYSGDVSRMTHHGSYQHPTQASLARLSNVIEKTRPAFVTPIFRKEFSCVMFHLHRESYSWTAV